MMFVVESPTRYAACVSSALMPSCMSIGTKIGARSAHFADADPTARFTKPVRKTIPTIVKPAGSASSRRKFAPFTARSAPRFDVPNAAMKSAQKKAMTM